jgi:antagonist of KipI
MTRGFKIIHPGILTTYQDIGRSGFRKFGIPQSGAIDVQALRTANLLVGNRESQVGLEVTLQGLKMVALRSLLVAVAGADLQFTINSEYYRPWRSFLLEAGDVVHFGRRISGLRAYLAARGGFRAPTYMGSSSVFEIGAMGTPLRKHDILEVDDAPQESLHERSIPEAVLPKISNEVCVRVIMGPQIQYFTSEGLSYFLDSVYRVKSQSDRMAYRLEGPRINHRGRADIISEPVLPGSIQVPSNGQPIILMVDGQVTGGYAKIANVISADMPILAQVIPGNAIRFKEVDLGCAYDALEQIERQLTWLRENMNHLSPDSIP